MTLYAPALDGGLNALHNNVNSIYLCNAEPNNYNDAVNTNNVRIASFPGVLVAGLGNFPEAELLHFQTDEKSDVDLKAAFSR